MNQTKIQAGLDRTKRPCRYCGRVMRRPNMSTHEPTCSPEARKAKRVRWMLHARAVRATPGWRRPPEKRDLCQCGNSKVTSAAHCKACDKGGPRTRPLADRFWPKVDQTAGPDGCWIWEPSKATKGYGRFNLGGDHGNVVVLAPRQAWELTTGPIPDGLQVLHRCDNPACVNPTHLFLGTPLDNMRDMIAKGRASWQRKPA